MIAGSIVLLSMAKIGSPGFSPGLLTGCTKIGLLKQSGGFYR